MSIFFYKVLHIFGVFFLATALGGLILHHLNGGTRDSNQSRALIGATHGIALVILLVSGIGMLHKYGFGFPGWAIAKILIWLVLGGLIALVPRFPKQARLLWFLVPILGGLAGYLAIYKPF